MKPIIMKLILSAFAAAALLPGVMTSTAEAQDRYKRRPPRVIIYQPYYPVYYDPFYDPYWDPYWWPTYRVVNPVAYQQEWGYREGRDEGKDDAEDGKPAYPAGNKDFYKSGSYAYRQAFIRGYYDGYREKIRY